MATYEFSRWDGKSQFQPQSADELFDELSKYLMHYGEEILPNLERWEDEHPDLVDMLVKRGLVERDREGKYSITPKGLKRVENKALEHLLQQSRRDQIGKHDTDERGPGQVNLEETRPYQFGDPVSNLNMHETLRNALQRQGAQTPIRMTEDDLVVQEMDYQSNCATVVLLDMSGSMTRGGKYGAAKGVAMAMQALVRTRYQGDFLQVVGFYSYASPLSERELLYSAPKPVSIFDPRVRMRIDLDNPPAFIPEHFTNIHAGLQFARRLLGKQSAQNRQILLITDGEPTAHLEGRQLVLLYPPAEKTAAITLAEAKRCADAGIRVSSFALIEDYFYHGLVNFVEQLAIVTRGVSATCNAEDMSQLVLSSFTKGRKLRRAL